MNRRMFLAAVAALAVAGCGRTQAPISVTPAPPPQIKPLLESIASSGEVGSEVELIRENLQQMSATDPDKADELLKDLDELQMMTDPGRVKAQADKMLAKL